MRYFSRDIGIESEVISILQGSIGVIYTSIGITRDPSRSLEISTLLTKIPSHFPNMCVNMCKNTCFRPQITDFNGILLDFT